MAPFRRGGYLSHAQTERAYTSNSNPALPPRSQRAPRMADVFPLRSKNAWEPKLKANTTTAVKAHARRTLYKTTAIRAHVRHVAFPHGRIYPREGMEGAAMAELRAERGDKCEECDMTETESEERYREGLEFAHVVPTGLRGMGRGIRQRAADIRKHPEAYRLWCKSCHTKHEQSSAGAFARAERYHPAFEGTIG